MTTGATPQANSAGENLTSTVGVYGLIRC
jgi:hypothetical protein